MEYVNLHCADGHPLRISRLGIGCEPLGGYDWGRIDVSDIESGIRESLESGLNYFDTAAVYGLGMSEERLGKVLGHRRKDVVLATKAGISWAHFNESGHRARTMIDGRPSTIRSSVEASLARLGVETIPLLFLHYPDPAVPIEESIGALRDLSREGKIRAVGVSNFSAEQLERARREAVISAAQLECSILNLAGEHERGSAREWCIENKIPIIAYGVLARGLLTGKYGPEPPSFIESDRRRRLPEFQPENYRQHYLSVLHLNDEAHKLRVPTAALAVRWALDVLGVDVAITGIKTRSHLLENLQSIDWVLPDHVIRSISRTLDQRSGPSA